MMMTHGGAPSPRPCDSCPYRLDSPPGLWSREEYERLPPFDEPETYDQPFHAFSCHQQDGRLCAGWVAVHDMEESMGLRMALVTGAVTAEGYQAALTYTTDVPLHPTGAAAAEHGLSRIDDPPPETIEKIRALHRRHWGRR